MSDRIIYYIISQRHKDYETMLDRLECLDVVKKHYNDCNFDYLRYLK